MLQLDGSQSKCIFNTPKERCQVTLPQAMGPLLLWFIFFISAASVAGRFPDGHSSECGQGPPVALTRCSL